MELIKEAVIKAKAGIQQRLAEPAGISHGPTTAPMTRWNIPEVSLDPPHMEERRIVSLTRHDPSFVAFNMLRTNIQKTLKDNGWRGLAITSPTPGCGKTTVVVNLALSMARQPDSRIVVLDLDLVKPAIGDVMGVRSPRTLADYFEGQVGLEQCFVRINENLFFALNDRPVRDSSETLQDGRLLTMLHEVDRNLRPDLTIFDLPPMRVGDDAIAFLPKVDCCALIAAAGETTAAEIQQCQEEIISRTKFVGIVLNKCTDTPKRQYYYYS